MKRFGSAEINGVVFDLDGTLYVCERFAAGIKDAAAAYISGLKDITLHETSILMTETHLRLSEETGAVQTLSAVCTELGGDIQGLHNFFVQNLRPESLLVRDERVIGLLQRLSGRFQLYIYTNNNRELSTRIINYLGLEGFFRGIFTIDDTWRAKPEEEMFLRVISEIGMSPSETLFVGDRYDVDLRVPEQHGCPVYLSQSLEQLLRLEELL